MKNIVKILLIIVLATTVFAESEDVFETCSHAVKFGKNYFESKYPIYIKNDNIYIPLRYFCDTIGIPIEWDNINKEVNVDIFDKKVNVSSKTKCIDAGIIPDEATAMAVGKAILEKHVGKTLEYETEDKVFYLTVQYVSDTNSWEISQWFDLKNGYKWAASGLLLPCVHINKNTGEVIYISTYSAFD